MLSPMRKAGRPRHSSFSSKACRKYPDPRHVVHQVLPALDQTEGPVAPAVALVLDSDHDEARLREPLVLDLLAVAQVVRVAVAQAHDGPGAARVARGQDERRQRHAPARRRGPNFPMFRRANPKSKRRRNSEKRTIRAV
jgi:hypothetical protein